MRQKIALLATMLLVQNATAAETVVTIPETVTTATRTPLPVTQIPAGVTVIDRQAIEDSGATTLGDVLTSVPGLHVSPSGGPGGQSSVFLRGSNSSHVLVLRDGMPINDASDPSGAFNFGVDTLSDVERIEVIRGPMAALYGSGAIGGVINLISRRGTEGKPKLEFDLSGGYPETIAAAAGASGVVGKFDYALTASSQSRLGFDYIPKRQSIYTGTPQGFRDRIGTANLGFTPVEGTRLSVFFRARQALFGFNTLGFPTFDAANSSGKTDSLLGRIGISSRLFDGVYETSAFLGRSQDDRRYVEPLAAADPNQTTRDDRYHAYRTDLQWNNTIHLNEIVPSATLTATDLTFGYQRIVDTIVTKVFDNYGGFPYTQSTRASMTTNAGYFGATTTIWKQLTLTAQVREDGVDEFSATTWRIGSVLQIPVANTALRAAFGSGFRAPSLYERFGVDSFGTVGNPKLKPERSEGWELGFTTTLPAAGRTDGLVFGGTYFNQQITDLITSVFVPVATSINIGSAHVQGFEAEVTARPAQWLTLHGSYTFTDTAAIGQAASIGGALLRRPRHMASADATVRPLPDLKIVARLTYKGEARDYLYDNGGFGTGYGVGQHGIVAGAVIAYDLNDKIQVHVNGTNIFNSRFEAVNGYQIPGAAVLAGVRIRL